MRSFYHNIFQVIKRSKLNSLIKIIGLVISFTAFLFLIVFVKYESGYDKHIVANENMYRVIRNWQQSKDFTPSTPVPLLGELISNFPEIETGTRFQELRNKIITNGEDVYHETEIYGVDTSFFSTFNLSLLSGNNRNALNEPNNVVISRSKSLLYFGNKNPIGEMLTFEGYPFNVQNKEVTITGVYNDYPVNTHFKPDFLVSLKSFDIYKNNNRKSHSIATYVKVKEGIDKTKLEEKLPNFLKSFYGNDYYNSIKTTYSLQPINDIHLNKSVYKYDYEAAKGSSRELVLFPILGLLILIISGINLVSLTISEGVKRGKSFGINKLSGAGKFYFFKIYWIESLVYNGFAVVIVLVITPLLLPFFNQLMERELDIQMFTTSWVLLIMATTITIMIILNSVIPVLPIQKNKTIDFLSGKKKGRHHAVSYKVISQTIQFAICIFLFVGSLGIYKQLVYIDKKTNESLSIENVLVINNARHLERSRETFKQNLLLLPRIKSVSICNEIPGNGYFSNWGFPVDEALEKVNVSVFECDPDYLTTLNIELAQGRFFDSQRKADANVIVLNEEAIKRLGWEDNPIGKRYNIGKEFTVVGVANNIHFESLQYEITPQAFIPNRHETSSGRVLVKLDTRDIDHSIQQIKAAWTKFVPNRDIRYNFLDNEYEQWYKSEKRTSSLSIVLSLIAIFLSSLGLLAAILFQVQYRIKEIGIRKVNGAKISEILTMLNRDFIKWVAVAFIVACPIAYYTMNKWLENFAYKTTLSWWIFALAGVLALGIALLTVSWQSWRAATRNPVEALRYE